MGYKKRTGQRRRALAGGRLEFVQRYNRGPLKGWRKFSDFDLVSKITFFVSLAALVATFVKGG